MRKGHHLNHLRKTMELRRSCLRSREKGETLLLLLLVSPMSYFQRISALGRSPLLEDLTYELLDHLRQEARTFTLKKMLTMISRALVGLGVLPKMLTTAVPEA